MRQNDKQIISFSSYIDPLIYPPLRTQFDSHYLISYTHSPLSSLRLTGLCVEKLILNMYIHEGDILSGANSHSWLPLGHVFLICWFMDFPLEKVWSVGWEKKNLLRQKNMQNKYIFHLSNNMFVMPFYHHFLNFSSMKYYCSAVINIA